MCELSKIKIKKVYKLQKASRPKSYGLFMDDVKAFSWNGGASK